MKINLKARLKNKVFWMAVIPAVFLAIQAVAAVFGFTLDLTELSGKVTVAVDAIFGVLVAVGIVVDPTTKGIGDSKQALTYEEPK